MTLPNTNELQRIRYEYDEAYREKRKRWSRDWNNKNKEKVALYKKLYARTDKGKEVARKAAKKYQLKQRGIIGDDNGDVPVLSAEDMSAGTDTVRTSESI